MALKVSGVQEYPRKKKSYCAYWFYIFEGLISRFRTGSIHLCWACTAVCPFLRAALLGVLIIAGSAEATAYTHFFWRRFRDCHMGLSPTLISLSCYPQSLAQLSNLSQPLNQRTRYYLLSLLLLELIQQVPAQFYWASPTQRVVV